MKGQIKRVLAILFAVLFIATLTASAVSADDVAKRTAPAVGDDDVATLTASEASINGRFIPNPEDPDFDDFWWWWWHHHNPYGPDPINPNILLHDDRFKLDDGTFKFEDSINFQELTQNGNFLRVTPMK